MATLHFHFDFISPYAYLGWTQIHALAERHAADVEPIPTLFGALLDVSGILGPGEIPAKRRYLFKDTSRTASVFGVPFRPPPAHPYSPLLALRVASIPRQRDDKRRLIDALFNAAWGDGTGIDTKERVASVLTRAGFDAELELERAVTDEVKSRLRAQTEDAIARGVFGVPTSRVGDELFWGVDSFGHLERHLAGSDPIAGWDPKMFDAPIAMVRAKK